MTPPDRIIIPFNKKGLRRWIVLYAGVCFGGSLFSVFLAATAFDSAHHGQWVWFLLALFEASLLSFCSIYIHSDWRFLTQQLESDNPALVVSEVGIEDYTSAYRVGALGWDEIERMYPTFLERRILSNRFFKTPIVRRDHCLFILLKTPSPYLKRLSQARLWFTRIDGLTGRGSWVAVPEALLSVSAADVMQSLNQFYITRVRNNSTPA